MLHTWRNLTENDRFFPPLLAQVMSCLKIDHKHYFFPVHQSITQYHIRSKYMLLDIVYTFIQKAFTQQSKCTDFPMYDLGTRHLDVYWRVGNDLGCMYILVQNGSVKSVVRYCCLCTVVFYNLCNVCDAGKYRTTVCYQSLCETQQICN
jgi:hypothetical protein